MTGSIEQTLDRIADKVIATLTSFFQGSAIRFLCAPITAFFSPKTYRDAVKASWRTGILYTAYSALILTVLVMTVFLERASTSDKFIHWVAQNVPTVIWTPQGLSLENGQKTATLTHPDYGPIAAFNMDRKEVTHEDMGKLFLYVTSKKLVFQKMLGELDERDVTRTTTGWQPLPARLRITGEVIETFYRNGKNTFLIATPLVLFPCSFIGWLIGNSAFMLAGLLLNLMRRQKLVHSEIFNLACLSTSVTLVTLSTILIALVFSLTLPSWLVPVSLILSLLSFAAAITLIEKPAPSPT